MLNVHLIYKPSVYWRILFWSGVYPRKFSCLKNFRSMVVAGRGCHKGIILQGIMTPTGVLPNGKSSLRRKRNVTGASVYVPRYRNSTYVHMSRQYIYETRRPKHPHSLIPWYKRCPQGPASRPPLQYTELRCWYIESKRIIWKGALRYDSQGNWGFRYKRNLLR